MTRKCDIANDQRKLWYSTENEIIYDTEVLKSNLCDYNDVYILVRVSIIIIEHNVARVVFKIFASFLIIIAKIEQQ